MLTHGKNIKNSHTLTMLFSNSDSEGDKKKEGKGDLKTRGPLYKNYEDPQATGNNHYQQIRHSPHVLENPWFQK